MQEILNDSTGSIILYKGYEKEVDFIAERKLLQYGLEQKKIRLFGREVFQPRLMAFFGDPGVQYKYSGKIFEARVWPVEIEQLRQKIDKEFLISFNSALLNYYRDGNDSMGLHSDDEPELGMNPTLFSLSFGAERKMIFRRKNSKEKIELALKNGDLLIMQGALQNHWKHEIPKQKRVKEPRLNITFRKVYSNPL